MNIERRPGSQSYQKLYQRLTRIAEQGPEALSARLDELDREWTSGRLVKAAAGVLLVTGLALTAWASPWWLILVAVAGAVLLQYLFLPRSLLADAFSWMGYRSGSEIEDERISLRVLRGDFRHLPTLNNIEDVDALARLEGEGGPSVEPSEDKCDAKDAASQILARAPNRKVTNAA